MPAVGAFADAADAAPAGAFVVAAPALIELVPLQIVGCHLLCSRLYLHLIPFRWM